MITRRNASEGSKRCLLVEKLIQAAAKLSLECRRWHMPWHSYGQEHMPSCHVTCIFLFQHHYFRQEWVQKSESWHRTVTAWQSNDGYTKTEGGHKQLSEMMSKNELCKLLNGIFPGRCRKAFHNCIMNIRSLILRICLLQSLISSWLGQWAIKKAGMLQNKECHCCEC